MFVSLALILVITGSGTSLTFLYEEDSDFLTRLCAGNVVGSALFGTLALLIACFLGLVPATVITTLLITILCFIVLCKTDKTRLSLLREFWAAGTNLNWLNFAYYVGLLLLLYFFFERAMMQTSEGIFTGSSHNYSDLSFHLGAIFSFTEGNNFPPENPSYANAKFTYPFLIDFLAACLVKPFGNSLISNVPDVLLSQNVSLGFSLFVLFEKFSSALTKNKLAGKLASLLLLFCGGLGFLIFFCDCSQDSSGGGRGFFDFLWHLPADYTIRQSGFRWGNSLTTLFITQRSLLLGMSVTFIVLTHLWKIFTKERQLNINSNKGISSFSNLITFQPQLPTFFVGLLASTLPLVHTHSLAVLFIVTFLLFIFRIDKWREWLFFGAGVCLIAVPELIWMTTGSASQITKFIGWHFGWGAGDENIFLFWLRNAGLFIPLLIVSLLINFFYPGSKAKVLFYLPFLFIFIIAHLIKLAPFEWDNIKVLIYWFAVSVPFVAWLLAVWWRKNFVFRTLAVICFFILTLAGMIDIWRVVSRQIEIIFFDRDAVALAEQIKQRTSPQALFLNAPTYNSPVVLSGRRSLMRSSGQLESYGIDYHEREADLKQIYSGSDLAQSLLIKNKIEYIIVSPQENELNINKEFFKKYPVIAESGRYRVYQIKSEDQNKP